MGEGPHDLDPEPEASTTSKKEEKEEAKGHTSTPPILLECNRSSWRHCANVLERGSQTDMNHTGWDHSPPGYDKRDAPGTCHDQSQEVSYKDRN